MPRQCLLIYSVCTKGQVAWIKPESQVTQCGVVCNVDGWGIYIQTEPIMSPTQVSPVSSFTFKPTFFNLHSNQTSS